jgi:predicted metalloprotease with PDZ domain
MTRAPRYCLALLLAAAAAPAFAQSSSFACRPDVLGYDIALRRGEVRVGVCVHDAGEDSAVFELPEWAGVETFGDNVAEISAATPDGTALPVVRRGTGRWVVGPGARRPFRLSYAIRHSKPSFMGNANGGQFQPTLFDRWALLWGPAYAVFPASDSLAVLPARVRVDGGPYGGVFPSWGADTLLANAEALRNSVLAAGDFRRQVREVDGVPVTFLAQGDWPFRDEDFAGAVERLLRTQAGAMGSYPARQLAVILVPGLPGSAGGTVVKDAMVVYPRPDTDAPRDPWALGLIAHEHFHLWNGEVAHPAASVPEGETKWFSEGFTDYYADLTLLRAGVLDEAALAERVNDRIREYLANPHARTATSALLGERYWVSQDYNRLPYVKGALAALLMDLRIRQRSGGGRSLDDFTRAVFAGLGEYRPAELQRTLEETTRLPWGDFLGEYVFGAGELPLREVCAEVGLECAAAPVTVFHLGFEVEGAMRPGAVVRSVDEGSPAARAGLRAGDVLGGYSFRREPTAPARIEVTRGTDRLTFDFLPAREITVPLLQPGEATRRVLSSLRRGTGDGAGR